jgi:hypothetical protein
VIFNNDITESDRRREPKSKVKTLKNVLNVIHRVYKKIFLEATKGIWWISWQQEAKKDVC